MSRSPDQPVSPGGLLRLDAAIRPGSCDSTQAVCRRLALDGAPEGTIVVALTQTSGYGREGRSWHSPPGVGLYASFLLRPRIASPLWIGFTALTALALAQAIDALGAATDEPIRVKWPNDLYGHGGKLAGILAETEGPAVIVGLGLNLEQGESDFPVELRERATSLRLERRRPPPSAEAVLEAFNAVWTSAYDRWQSGARDFLAEGLRRRSLLTGRTIRLRLPGPGVLEGIAVDVGECGELIVETAGGRRTVVSGEIEWFGPPPSS